MPFRFVHTADLHLDSPLKSLAFRNVELADLVGSASRIALQRIVDLCLEERVDALIIAGDLYDGDQTSMKTARFLATQMARLDDAGVKVFKVRGNHDAASRITAELVLPPCVTVFGGRGDYVELGSAVCPVAIHGVSFAKPQAPDSLLPKFKAPREGLTNIGILHTSLAGAAGHDTYAPCSLADLERSGFRYWALGHIHVRSEYIGNAHVVMPGIPQGRDINEAGRKTVSLVTVGDDGAITVEERAVGTAEFQRVTVDVEGLTEWTKLVTNVNTALEQARDGVDAEHAIVRLQLHGATPLHFRMLRDRDLLLAEAEKAAEQTGRTWIDRLIVEAGPVQTSVSDAAGPLIELQDLMGRARGDLEIRQEVEELVAALVTDLPPELRDLAGHSDDERSRFIDKLLVEGSSEVLAKLAGSRGEAA
ncbi:metallophosphoesterase family protein [Phreatobacter oligotrophus]|uniref:DNA repair exonuclease SbcCD nuclease subunit n=1 Tax=Phreatobacter oligotrophus TaxID=1122261 RepID=A0A2T4ZDW8_9HYPH|nr:DNA repair exonuclease [Phreatobacter oligotrophus]PTM60080.1 DNA repair exonuclease SbcCD nuclease subunit [Phreatobacter oligotrophus]